MDDQTLHAKNEILQWVLGLEDEEIIQNLLDLKNAFEQENVVSEPQTKMLVKDDFEKRWTSGMNSAQSRAESKRRIREWWGK